MIGRLLHRFFGVHRMRLWLALADGPSVYVCEYCPAFRFDRR